MVPDDLVLSWLSGTRPGWLGRDDGAGVFLGKQDEDAVSVETALRRRRNGAGGAGQLPSAYRPATPVPAWRRPS